MPFDLVINQFARLNDFRDSGFLTDVTIVVKDVKYRAHKVVLSCDSPVFEAMFKSGMLETTSGEIVIDDVSPNTFKLYLDFIYTGDLPVTKPIRDYIELLMCGDKYQTSSLLLALDSRLNRGMTSSNALFIREVASKLHRTTLEHQSTIYIWLNLSKVMKSISWKNNVAQNKQLRNDLLMKFHKNVDREESFEMRCSSYRVDIYRFYQFWTFKEGLASFRPKGVKFILDGKLAQITVVFTRIGTQTAVSLCPSTLPNRPVMFDCKITVCREGEVCCSTKAVAWDLQQSHPTLGPRRLEVARWGWWDPEKTSVEVEISALHNCVAKIPYNEWKIDSGSEQFADTKPSECGVCLRYGDKRGWIDLSDKTKFLEPNFVAFRNNQKELELTNVSDESVQIILRYMKSGLFPQRHKVDLQLLEAALTLDLSNLVVFIETTLTWDLDPSNVVERANFSYARGPNCLLWACAQYVVLHLERVAQWDDEWRNFPFEYFEIVCREMRDKLHPRLLPKFLIDSRVQRSST